MLKNEIIEIIVSVTSFFFFFQMHVRRKNTIYLIPFDNEIDVIFVQQAYIIIYTRTTSAQVVVSAHEY